MWFQRTQKKECSHLHPRSGLYLKIQMTSSLLLWFLKGALGPRIAHLLLIPKRLGLQQHLRIVPLLTCCQHRLLKQVLYLTPRRGWILAIKDPLYLGNLFHLKFRWLLKVLSVKLQRSTKQGAGLHLITLITIMLLPPAMLRNEKLKVLIYYPFNLFQIWSQTLKVAKAEKSES